MTEINEFIQKLKEVLSSGGSYCSECGIFFDTVIQGRQHDLAEHYEWALTQCYGDKKKLLEWANSTEPYDKSYYSISKRGIK